MAQTVLQIEQAFDAAMLNISGVGTTYPLVKENTGSNYAMQPDTTSLLQLRTTLVPAETTVATVGGTYLYVKGMYVCDIIATQNVGVAGPKGLADAILQYFKPGMLLTQTNGDVIQIENASPSVQLSYGARTMGKIYLTQVQIKYFGYPTP